MDINETEKFAEKILNKERFNDFGRKLLLDVIFMQIIDKKKFTYAKR